MLREAVLTYTRRGRPHGCLVVSSASSVSPDGEGVRDWLASHRRQRTAAIIARLQQAQAGVGIAHHRAFGDLPHQMAGRDGVAFDHRAHVLQQMRRTELYRRQVHRHRPAFVAGVVPAPQLLAGLVQRPAADVVDRAAAFGQADEAIRRNQAMLGMAPADQRLGAGHPS
ncbi:hypothetical protein G6F58_012869 [Rhizopus delemar]|nr:hypothetical protein G6F58_012869 [Rhizopus delemar]